MSNTENLSLEHYGAVLAQAGVKTISLKLQYKPNNGARNTFLSKSYFKIPGIVYDAQHPDKKAHQGSAIMVKINIIHREPNFQTDHLQGINIKVYNRLQSYTV